MNKKAEGIIGYIIVIIIAFFMASIIWTQTRTATTAGDYSEEESLVVNTWSALNFDDVVSGTVTVTNKSNSSFVENTHFNMSYAKGKVLINAVSGATSGDYLVNYSYYPDNYNKNSTGRTLTSLLGVFMAILVLVIIVKKIADN